MENEGAFSCQLRNGYFFCQKSKLTLPNDAVFANCEVDFSCQRWYGGLLFFFFVVRYGSLELGRFFGFFLNSRTSRRWPFKPEKRSKNDSISFVFFDVLGSKSELLADSGHLTSGSQAPGKARL